MRIDAGLVEPELIVEAPHPLPVRAPAAPAPGEARAAESANCIQVGEFVLDTRSYELHTPHKGRLRLTPVQYDLLYHLMSHPGQIFSPARLLDDVWDYPSDTSSPDLVRVHIKNLRQRIEEDPTRPRFIRTVPGYGYTTNMDAN